MLALAALACVVLPVAAIAQAPAAQRPDEAAIFQSAFDGWVAKYKPETAFALVQIGGRPVFARGINTDPNAAAFIGSMSKAITGACVAALIGEGKLSFATPMKDALPGYFKKHGPHSDRRFEAVTVEQLLVHRSGLRGNSDGDPIHDMIKVRAADGRGGEDSDAAMLAEHFKRPLLREPGTDFSYSNTGYVALAQIIAERSGKRYEDYCKSALFDKLGIKSARLHPDWRVLSGAGGWFIAPGDYLTFMKIFDANHPFLPQVAKDWIDAVRAKWPPPNPRGTWYSLGMNTHANFGKWYVTHGGLLNSNGRDKAGRPTKAVISSTAIRAADGTALVYGITPVVGIDTGALTALRDALNGAIDTAKKR